MFPAADELPKKLVSFYLSLAARWAASASYFSRSLSRFCCSRSSCYYLLSSSCLRFDSRRSFSSYYRFSSFSSLSRSLASSLASFSCSRANSLEIRSLSLTSSRCFFSSSRSLSFSYFSNKRAYSFCCFAIMRSASLASLWFSFSCLSSSIYRRFSSSFWRRSYSFIALACSLAVVSLRFCTSLM